MKDILFDSYRQYQKESKDSTIKAFFKLPVPALVLLCVSLACVVFNFVVIIFDLVASLGIVCLMAEIAIYIVLYLYTDSYQIKASNTRVKTYVKYCSDLLTWFRKVGFVASKENLLDLISRVDEHINDSQQRKKNNQQRFDANVKKKLGQCSKKTRPPALLKNQATRPKNAIKKLYHLVTNAIKKVDHPGFFRSPGGVRIAMLGSICL